LLILGFCRGQKILTSTTTYSDLKWSVLFLRNQKTKGITVQTCNNHITTKNTVRWTHSTHFCYYKKKGYLLISIYYTLPICFSAEQSSWEIKKYGLREILLVRDANIAVICTIWNSPPWSFSCEKEPDQDNSSPGRDWDLQCQAGERRHDQPSILK